MRRDGKGDGGKPGLRIQMWRGLRGEEGDTGILCTLTTGQAAHKLLGGDGDFGASEVPERGTVAMATAAAVQALTVTPRWQFNGFISKSSQLIRAIRI